MDTRKETRTIVFPHCNPTFNSQTQLGRGRQPKQWPHIGVKQMTWQADASNSVSVHPDEQKKRTFSFPPESVIHRKEILADKSHRLGYIHITFPVGYQMHWSAQTSEFLTLSLSMDIFEMLNKSPSLLPTSESGSTFSSNASLSLR